MILSQGFPSNLPKTPVISPSFLNGQGGPLYRPLDANRLPYSQQWNFTVDHQFTNNFYISAAYVANKGTRLLSDVAPINVLNPSLLSKGQQLFDEFQPGQTVLDGVPEPYSGLDRTDAGMRSFGGASSASVPSVLQLPDRSERERRQLYLSFPASEGGTSLFEGTLVPGYLHVLETVDRLRLHSGFVAGQRKPRSYRRHLGFSSAAGTRLFQSMTFRIPSTFPLSTNFHSEKESDSLTPVGR